MKTGSILAVLRSLMIFILLLSGLIATAWVILPRSRSDSEVPSDGQTILSTDDDSDSVSESAVNENSSAAEGQFKGHDFVEKAKVLFDLPESDEQKLQALDRAFLKFIRDKRVSRKEKINILMELLNDRQGFQAVYILDYLAALVPIERGQDLINFFQTSGDDEFRRHVLTALRDTFTTDWQSLGPDAPSQEAIQEWSLIISSFTESLAFSKDPMAWSAILDFTPLIDRKARDRILASLTPDRLAELTVTPEDYGGLVFECAIADPKNAEIIQYWNNLNLSSLLSNADFAEKVLLATKQLGRDTAVNQFLRSSMDKMSIDPLNPHLFVMAMEAHMALTGVPESEAPVEMRKAFRAAGIEEKAAILLGTDENLLADETASFKLELIEEFVHYADSKDDRTRIHLLKSALTLSSEMEHTQESAAITQRICGLLGEESLAFNVCNPGMVSSNPE